MLWLNGSHVLQKNLARGLQFIHDIKSLSSADRHHKFRYVQYVVELKVKTYCKLLKIDAHVAHAHVTNIKKQSLKIIFKR